LVARDLAELRGAACAKEENQIIFLIFSFPCLGLNPTDVHGVKPWEPPPSYLLTPTSYLYYFIRLLMSLISIFFFALTFDKPLNYFTCEKEAF
jgi:hypothetical protein